MPTLPELTAWVRAHPGRSVLAGVVAFLVIATVIDLPARLAVTTPEPAAPTPQTTRPQGQLSNLVTDENEQLDRCVPGVVALARCGAAPAFRDGEWFNTRGRPLTVDALRDKVVLVDFFSGSCINCRRDARYLRAWDERYRADGLRIVGVHSPEFEFEKKSGHVADVVRALSLRFPVLRDDALSTGSAYRSRFLPAKYLVDVTGTVRAISFGEGSYTRIEKQIRVLLADASPGSPLAGPVGVLDDAETPAPGTTKQINLGDSRGTGYDAERDAVVGKDASYILAPGQADDTYSLGGRWTVGTQSPPRG